MNDFCSNHVMKFENEEIAEYLHSNKRGVIRTMKKIFTIDVEDIRHPKETETSRNIIIGKNEQI